MNAAVVSALVLAAGSMGVALLTFWNNRASRTATNKIETGKVEIEGKKVDLSILEASVENLQRDVVSLRADLEHEREQRKLSNGYARTLAQVLRDHNMPVPPPPAGLDLP